MNCFSCPTDTANRRRRIPAQVVRRKLVLAEFDALAPLATDQSYGSRSPPAPTSTTGNPHYIPRRTSPEYPLYSGAGHRRLTRVRTCASGVTFRGQDRRDDRFQRRRRYVKHMLSPRYPISKIRNPRSECGFESGFQSFRKRVQL